MWKSSLPANTHLCTASRTCFCVDTGRATGGRENSYYRYSISLKHQKINMLVVPPLEIKHNHKQLQYVLEMPSLWNEGFYLWLTVKSICDDFWNQCLDNINLFIQLIHSVSASCDLVMAHGSHIHSSWVFELCAWTDEIKIKSNLKRCTSCMFLLISLTMSFPVASERTLLRSSSGWMLLIHSPLRWPLLSCTSRD